MTDPKPDGRDGTGDMSSSTPKKSPVVVSPLAPMGGLGKTTTHLAMRGAPGKIRIEDAMLADALTLPAGDDTRAMARGAGLSEALINVMLGAPREGSSE
jgi:hypothetical protein